MGDWKAALKNVVHGLGLNTGEERNRSQKRIDVSRWFPAAKSKPQKEAVPNDKSPAKEPTISILKQDQGQTVRRQEPALNRRNSSASTRAIEPPAGKPTRPESQLRPNPARGIQPVQQVSNQPFAFPDVSGLSVSVPECIARKDQTNSGNPRTAVRGRKEICVLGLDFGTAFTKACVGLRGKHLVVHWDGCVEYPDSYLLPTIFTELAADRTCVLGRPADWKGDTHAGLKMALLNSPTRQQKLRAVVYLALVMRYVRSWLWSKQRHVIEGFELEWIINIGLPTDHWDDDGPTQSLFRFLAMTAWRLAQDSADITLDGADRQMSALESFQIEDEARFELELEKITAFPEFGAQIHSYSTTTQSRRDLHLLIDIGAGTVDIVTFHIGADDESELNAIMYSLVENAGTHALLQTRIAAGGLSSSEIVWTDTDTQFSRAEFEEHHRLRRGCLASPQYQFTELLGFRIRKVLSETKRTRYASSANWGELPCFITGGGRRVDAYGKAPAIAIENLMVTLSPMPLPLPPKDSLELGTMPPDNFHRLSVAHGLSFTPLAIQRTLRKRETDNIPMGTPSREHFTDSLVDKSQV
jgi:hypothetical protein